MKVENRYKKHTQAKEHYFTGSLILGMKNSYHRVKEIFHRVSSLSKAFVYHKYIMFVQCI